MIGVGGLPLGLAFPLGWRGRTSGLLRTVDGGRRGRPHDVRALPVTDSQTGCWYTSGQNARGLPTLTQIPHPVDGLAPPSKDCTLQQSWGQPANLVQSFDKGFTMAYNGLSMFYSAVTRSPLSILQGLSKVRESLDQETL